MTSKDWTIFQRYRNIDYYGHHSFQRKEHRELQAFLRSPGGIVDYDEPWRWLLKPRCVEAPRVSWELMKLAEALCSGQWSMALPTALWTGLLASTFLDLWSFHGESKDVFTYFTYSEMMTSRHWGWMTVKSWPRSRGRSCFKRWTFISSLFCNTEFETYSPDHGLLI